MLKSNQIIKRELSIEYQVYGVIEQRTQDEYFNATKIAEAYFRFTGQEKRLDNYFNLESTKKFIKTIAYNESRDPKQIIKTTKGKYGGTWVHPYLFVDLAMWFCPSLNTNQLKLCMMTD